MNVSVCVISFRESVMADLLLLGITGYTFGWPSHGNNHREPTNDAKISTQKGGQVTLINNIDRGIFLKKYTETLGNGQNSSDVPANLFV